jgi:hypothetical protein
VPLISLIIRKTNHSYDIRNQSKATRENETEPHEKIFEARTFFGSMGHLRDSHEPLARGQNAWRHVEHDFDSSIRSLVACACRGCGVAH